MGIAASHLHIYMSNCFIRRCCNVIPLQSHPLYPAGSIHHAGTQLYCTPAANKRNLVRGDYLSRSAMDGIQAVIPKLVSWGRRCHPVLHRAAVSSGSQSKGDLSCPPSPRKTEGYQFIYNSWFHMLIPRCLQNLGENGV